MPPKGLSAKQARRDCPLIVVDPGHGGHDYGSSGYLKKVYEKDIALQIAGRLAKKIRKKLPYEVLMTRNSDSYLTLEERTAIANTKNADLFISIHTNDSENQSTYGIETYVLNLATENSEITVAARENATSTKNISDLQTILTDIMQNTKIDESSLLASYIQDSSYKYLRSRYTDVKNNGVKKAPFYVLLGARMPAVLIETSFISNPRECKRLSSASYQDHLCEGIINGIRKYVEKSRSAS
jgi:N-acetylmuramoyl-L-alanine amidase